MAKDNLENEEPEENDNIFDDDDFGLPDLEYDELDDDLDSDDNADVSPDFSDDELSADDGFDTDDLETVDFSSIDSLDEEETDTLTAATEDEDEGLILADDDDSDDEFSGLIMNDDDDEEEGILEPGHDPTVTAAAYSALEDDDDDEFAGLPDLDDDESDSGLVFGEEDDNDDLDMSGLDDFNPEEYQEVPNETSEYAYVSSHNEQEKKGNFRTLLILGLSAVALLAALAFYFSGGDDEAAAGPALTNVPVERPVQQQEEPAVTPQETETEPVASEPDPVVDNTPVASGPNTANAGTITRLSGRNGNSYIIVGSFVDSDLADDFAKKLAADGQSPYIIPPFGKSQRTRVGIAEYGNYTSASAGLDNYKAEYGNDVWTLRY